MKKLILCLLVALSFSMAYGDNASPPLSKPADIATAFLAHLDKAETDAAISLWDGTLVNDKVKARIEKMSRKVRKSGGIKKVDVGTCEARRVKSFEEKAGEKIDVVPVEIICGNESLILAVFSVRRAKGAYLIFQLESLKEWGGTTSLDDDLPYSH